VTAKGDKRAAVVAAYQQLLAAGLGTGSSGNLSVRVGQGMLITPTGLDPATLEPQQLVAMSLQGEVTQGQLRPSSEWHMHAAVYLARPDVNAVVHCHSRYATILACAHRPIPALHYMIAITGRDEIPVAPYATFGTGELARATTAALGAGRACLLANHGQLAAAESLEMALRVAVEVEELAAMYWGSLAIGAGEILSPAQMAEVKVAFATYGQQAKD
jgi:L-fuculose-phosphate aldolase